MMVKKEMGYQEDNEFDEYLDQNEQEKQPSRYEGRQLLLVFQIVTCIIIICAVVILKFIGGNTYLAFNEWYQKEVNNSIIAGENLNAYQSVWNNVKFLPGNTQSQSSAVQK